MKLILQSLFLLAAMVGLMLGLIYAPDYLNYQPWAATYTTPTGVQYTDPLEVASTEIVFVVYWFADCSWCAKQREALRQFVSEFGQDRMGIIYVNPIDSLGVVIDYIGNLDEPKLEDVQENWLQCSETFMGTYPTVEAYINGELVVQWDGYKSYEDLVEMLVGDE